LIETKLVNQVDLYGDEIGSVEYVQHMGTDLTIVNSARVSFGKEKLSLDESDEKLIKYLAKHKHTSTFEHNVMTFRFKVPLYVRSQHHRHRTWSYNEISRRYTDVDLKFYEPKGFRTQHKSNRQASNAEELINPVLSCGSDCDEMVSLHHQMSLDLFNRMIESGVCREQARGVLPQNLYTEYYGTTNLSNLLKFIELRVHEGAQWEIQQVALACLEIAKSRWPIAVQTYQDTLLKHN
jgi:thymidylate synthase (FAD)